MESVDAYERTTAGHSVASAPSDVHLILAEADGTDNPKQTKKRKTGQGTEESKQER
jgi:hypothetical protein